MVSVNFPSTQDIKDNAYEAFEWSKKNVLEAYELSKVNVQHGFDVSKKFAIKSYGKTAEFTSQKFADFKALEKWKQAAIVIGVIAGIALLIFAIIGVVTALKHLFPSEKSKEAQRIKHNNFVDTLQSESKIYSIKLYKADNYKDLAEKKELLNETLQGGGEKKEYSVLIKEYDQKIEEHNKEVKKAVQDIKSEFTIKIENSETTIAAKFEKNTINDIKELITKEGDYLSLANNKARIKEFLLFKGNCQVPIEEIKAALNAGNNTKAELLICNEIDGEFSLTFTISRKDAKKLVAQAQTAQVLILDPLQNELFTRIALSAKMTAAEGLVLASAPPEPTLTLGDHSADEEQKQGVGKRV